MWVRLRVAAAFRYGCGYTLHLPAAHTSAGHIASARMNHLASATIHLPAFATPPRIGHTTHASQEPCVSMRGGGWGGLHALTSTHFLDPRTLTRTHYLHAHAHAHAQTPANTHARAHANPHALRPVHPLGTSIPIGAVDLRLEVGAAHERLHVGRSIAHAHKAATSGRGRSRIGLGWSRSIELLFLETR